MIYKEEIMTTINNTPKKYNDTTTNALRGAIEHRATWMYLLLDEARKAGLSWDDFARKGIFKCGLFHSEHKIKENCVDINNFEEFFKPFLSEEMMKVLEVEIIEKTPDVLDLDFHYCPLVTAWQKLGCSQEDIEKLCDIAMDGDRGIAEGCGYDFTIGSKIAEGDDTCRITFNKKK